MLAICQSVWFYSLFLSLSLALSLSLSIAQYTHNKYRIKAWTVYSKKQLSLCKIYYIIDFTAVKLEGNVKRSFNSDWRILVWGPLSSLKYNCLLALFIVLPFDWQRVEELLKQNCVKSNQSAFIQPQNLIYPQISF